MSSEQSERKVCGTQTHYFKLDDNNSGNIYRIAIESELSSDEILTQLYQYSNYVVYLKSSPKPHKKEKGSRYLQGLGHVRAYSHYVDKINTFSMRLNKEVDLRHAL